MREDVRKVRPLPVEKSVLHQLAHDLDQPHAIPVQQRVRHVGHLAVRGDEIGPLPGGVRLAERAAEPPPAVELDGGGVQRRQSQRGAGAVEPAARLRGQVAHIVRPYDIVGTVHFRIVLSRPVRGAGGAHAERAVDRLAVRERQARLVVAEKDYHRRLRALREILHKLPQRGRGVRRALHHRGEHALVLPLKRAREGPVVLAVFVRGVRRVVFHGYAPDEHGRILRLALIEVYDEVGHIVVGIELPGYLVRHVAPVIRCGGRVRVYGREVVGEEYLVEAELRIEPLALVDAVVEGVYIGRVVARVPEELRHRRRFQQPGGVPLVDVLVRAEKAAVDAGEHLHLDVGGAVAQRVGVERAGHALLLHGVEVRHGVAFKLDARQLRHVEEGLGEHEDDVRRLLPARFGLVGEGEFLRIVNEPLLRRAVVRDVLRLLLPRGLAAEHHRAPEAQQRPAAGVDIGLRIGCAGGARRAHGGVEPALRPGGHAVEADKERRGRQRRHQRAPVGHFQRAGGEKEPDERRCGEREGQHREAGDGDGRAVELHDAAQARDQVEVGQVERRGGDERLIIVGRDQRERGQGRQHAGGEEALHQTAERADQKGEEYLRRQRLRRAAKGVNRRLRYALLLDYGGRKREYQRENKARRGGEQRDVFPQPPRRNAW